MQIPVIPSFGRTTRSLPQPEMRFISTPDHPQLTAREEVREQSFEPAVSLRSQLMRQRIETRQTGPSSTAESTISNPATVEPTPPLPIPDWIERDQIKAILEICTCELCELLNDDIVNAKTSALLKLIRAGTERNLEYKEWANLSLHLEQLLARIAARHNYQMGRTEFLRQNLVNLEKTCRYAWARAARAELVKIFTRDNVSVTVNNPALQDITLKKVSVEAGTPLPFLSGAVELGYQTMKYVNDEGYIMRTRTGSVALSARASAHLGMGASARGKVMGGTGPLEYCRTAQDDARYFFNDILDDNIDLPRLAPYLSRAGALGSGSGKKIEIRNFEAIQNDFLIQQDRIAQYFSVLLSSPITMQLAEYGPFERAAYQQWRVGLKATAEIQARVLSGSVSTAFGSLGGMLSFGLAQADLTGEKVKKTTSAKRTRTLCELLKDDNLDHQTKAALSGKIASLCDPVRQNLIAKFWGPEVLDQGTLDHAKVIARLRQDLKHYTRAHAWCVQGQPGAAGTLRKFHETYLARDTAQMLGHMALLIADSYARVAQWETGSEQLAQLMELEHDLFHCGIPKARQILETQALARQQYRYVQNEINGQITVGAGVFGAAHAQTVKYSRWSLNHYESFAAGDYEKIDFTLGLSQEVNRQVLQSVNDYIKANIPGVSAFFGADSYSRQGSYSVRYFRPSAFANQPFCKQYERIVVQENLQLGIKVPLPVALPVSIQVAASYSSATTTMRSETPASESLCYFARHYMHARQTKKTEANGKINQDSYWYRLEREHQDVFRQFFLHYAATRHTGGQLLWELDAIEQGLPFDDAGRVQCLIARKRFLDCTEQLLGQPSSARHYDACLKELKAMLNVWFPYWLKRREHSPIYGAWRVGVLR